jgi:hypothetical protein
VRRKDRVLRSQVLLVRAGRDDYDSHPEVEGGGDLEREATISSRPRFCG